MTTTYWTIYFAGMLSFLAVFAYLIARGHYKPKTSQYIDNLLHIMSLSVFWPVILVLLGVYGTLFLFMLGMMRLFNKKPI
jgi:hypothetical protein